MNRNTNAHFAEMPSVDIQRSILDRSCSHKFAGNVGDVIPIYVDPDILPGDTVQMDTSKVVRFQTLLTPMMDNIQADVYWFFVPHRLVWDHWINFMGENTDSAWIPQTEYSIPQLRVPPKGDASNNKVGTILDYMGFPVEMPLTEAVEVNALPIRAYCKVMDDWFRSEALTDPLNIYTGDATVDAVSDASYINDVPHGGKPFKAAKYADYFSSCLPSPQKGNPVTFPIKVGGDEVGVFASKTNYDNLSTNTDLVFRTRDANNVYIPMRVNQTNNFAAGGAYDFQSVAGDNQPNGVWPVNLATFIPIMESSFTVNDMRYAFQLQKLLEKDARSGSRYIEVIREHFGIKSSDARLQRSEYLGGNRFAIVVDQVSNQAQTEKDFLGDLGAFSVTSDVHSDFTFSAQEHGTLLGLMVLRYDHTYSQGLEKFWSRKTRFNYYWPVFANIGEQPVLKKEIFLTGSDKDDQTFGYNEAWADYRYKPNRVSSYMRPYIKTGLFSWSLADDYDSTPSLSDSWIREDASTVDRVLAVTKEASGFQFWADVYFSTKYTRPMPVYSVPGLIDHH